MIQEKKQVLFADNLQAASDYVITDIIKDNSKKSLIISSFPDIEHRWRNALSVAHTLPCVSVVKGSAKDRERAVHSRSEIIFLTPGSIHRLSGDEIGRIDLMVVDNLYELVAAGKDKKNAIISLSGMIPETVGISYSLNGNHLSTLWDELRIIGVEQRIGISKSSYYEKYYFSERIAINSGYKYIRELKPGALTAVKKCLENLVVEIKEKNAGDTYRYFIPMDYHEKSIERFVRSIMEDTSNERS